MKRGDIWGRRERVKESLKLIKMKQHRSRDEEAEAALLKYLWFAAMREKVKKGRRICGVWETPR